MKAWFLLVPLMIGVAAGQASAADGGGLGTVLKDAATDAAGQAARDTIDKTAPRRDDRDVRDRDRDRRDWRDRGDGPGKSYDHRRDGRGAQDNPGNRGQGDKRHRRDGD